jgi:hypothetical protein
MVSHGLFNRHARPPPFVAHSDKLEIALSSVWDSTRSDPTTAILVSRLASNVKPRLEVGPAVR